jgi:hypothetical protein
MRIFGVICVSIFAALLVASPSRAQKIELFGGYSYVHAPVTFVQAIACPIPGCPSTSNTTRLNLNGWEGSAAVKVLGPLAIVGDFDGTFGSFEGVHVHLQTYLVGPQLRLPGPISPFAHFLVGGAHEAFGSGGPAIPAGGLTQNAFATAVGGGLDLKVLPFISLRPIQVDYLLTHFNSATQNQPRISAGIVLRF